MIVGRWRRRSRARTRPAPASFTGTPWTPLARSVRALTQWCFTDLKRHRVQIRAARENIASRAIPERLGFMEEGLLRQAAIVAGVRQDMVLYARLRTD